MAGKNNTGRPERHNMAVFCYIYCVSRSTRSAEAELMHHVPAHPNWETHKHLTDLHVSKATLEDVCQASFSGKSLVW